MNIITHGSSLQHLDYLLEFLAAWEKRPGFLTPMAYQWCSAISEAAERLGQRGTSPSVIEIGLRSIFREREGLAIDEVPDSLSLIVEGEFSRVGPSCDLVRVGNTPNHTQEDTLEVTILHLLITLEIGFRLAKPGIDQPALHLDHTPHHDWVFETVFSGHDDEAIADAVSVWIAGGGCHPPGSYVQYFAKRVEREEDFSTRLRQVGICAIEHIWDSELEVSAFDTVQLLNRLSVNVDDMEKQDRWAQLLIGVVCLPLGLKNLSSHYWHLLDKLEWYNLESASKNMDPGPCNTVITSLEKDKDWEKLEVWMGIVWQSMVEETSIGGVGKLTLQSLEDIGRVTPNLLQQQPSALPRFKTLCETNKLQKIYKLELQQMCNQVLDPPPLGSYPEGSNTEGKGQGGESTTLCGNSEQ